MQNKFMKWVDRKLHVVAAYVYGVMCLIFMVTIPAMSKNVHWIKYKLGDTLTTVVVQVKGGDVRMVSYKVYCVQVNDSIVTFSKK